MQSWIKTCDEKVVSVLKKQVKRDDNSMYDHIESLISSIYLD